MFFFCGTQSDSFATARDPDICRILTPIHAMKHVMHSGDPPATRQSRPTNPQLAHVAAASWAGKNADVGGDGMPSGTKKIASSSWRAKGFSVSSHGRLDAWGEVRDVVDIKIYPAGVQKRPHLQEPRKSCRADLVCER